MRSPAAKVLKEAAQDVHPNETFERTLSRTVREHQGTYKDYVDLIGRVRDRAERDKEGLVAAARALADEM